MWVSGKVATFCLALLATVSAVSAVKKLNSIEDLKKINFGQTVPKHSLVLLHWFANTIDIDNNDNMWLTFEPNRRDYGSHHYGNYERILDPLPYGRRYYTVGNVNQGTSVQLVLPNYVLHSLIANDGRNRDRIIFRVQDQNRLQALQRIDEVYITQHYGGSNSGTSYDPTHTYRITTNLLLQLREFSVETNHNTLRELRDDFGRNIDDSQLRSLKMEWGNLACLALLLCIVIDEKWLPKRSNNVPRQPAPKRNTQPHLAIDIPDDMPVRGNLQMLMCSEQIRLDVKTGKNGKARIEWHGVPDNRLQKGVMVQLFEDNRGQDATFTKTIGTPSGFCDTNVPLNTGLQARLHKTRTQCCFWTVAAEEICRGEEFQNPGRVQIKDYDASLQLFVKDGKACARLFVSKSFYDWRQVFRKSWVGFYADAYKATNEYDWWQWQWATKFDDSTLLDNSHFVYEYHSSMKIAPGVQVRFILKDGVEKAHTAGWK